MRFTTFAIASILLSTMFTAILYADEIENLNWLAGHWCGVNNDIRIEENWLPSDGNMLMGLSRVSRSGKTISFEYMRLTSDINGVSYIVQPNGGRAVIFTRSAGGSDWIRFENPEHDFPQRITYHRNGKELVAEIEGPGKDGDAMMIPFKYVLCELEQE